MFEEGLEVAEVLEQFQDVLAALHLLVEVVLIENSYVVVQFVDAGSYASHQFKI